MYPRCPTGSRRQTKNRRGNCEICQAVDVVVGLGAVSLVVGVVMKTLQNHRFLLRQLLEPTLLVDSGPAPAAAAIANLHHFHCLILQQRLEKWVLLGEEVVSNGLLASRLKRRFSCVSRVFCHPSSVLTQVASSESSSASASGSGLSRRQLLHERLESFSLAPHGFSSAQARAASSWLLRQRLEISSWRLVASSPTGGANMLQE